MPPGPRAPQGNREATLMHEKLIDAEKASNHASHMAVRLLVYARVSGVGSGQGAGLMEIRERAVRSGSGCR
eukprot:2069010-Pyramimonas_sp.AAC.1